MKNFRKYFDAIRSKHVVYKSCALEVDRKLDYNLRIFIHQLLWPPVGMRVRNIERPIDRTIKFQVSK